MDQLLYFILGVIVGGAGVWLFIGERKSIAGSKLIVSQAEEKERGKRAIMVLLESGNGPLTNNHVEQMLSISDATATRYLDELEKEGKVRQVGETGKYTYYEKI